MLAQIYLTPEDDANPAGSLKNQDSLTPPTPEKDSPSNLSTTHEGEENEEKGGEGLEEQFRRLREEVSETKEELRTSQERWEATQVLFDPQASEEAQEKAIRTVWKGMGVSDEEIDKRLSEARSSQENGGEGRNDDSTPKNDKENGMLDDRDQVIEELRKKVEELEKGQTQSSRREVEDRFKREVDKLLESGEEFGTLLKVSEQLGGNPDKFRQSLQEQVLNGAHDILGDRARKGLSIRPDDVEEAIKKAGERVIERNRDFIGDPRGLGRTVQAPDALEELVKKEPPKMPKNKSEGSERDLVEGMKDALARSMVASRQGSSKA